MVESDVHRQASEVAVVWRMNAVCHQGDFPIAAVALEHLHIYGQLRPAHGRRGRSGWVYDDDPQKVEDFCIRYPGVKER